MAGGGEGPGGKLARAVWLLTAHPEVATRDCGDCQRWLYDDRGNVERRPKRTGLPVVRPAGTDPPCGTCPKVPKGLEPSPANATQVTARVLRCVEHYRECRAVGWRVPDAGDPLVRHHAAVIRQVEDDAAANRFGLLGLILAGKGL